MAGFSKENSIGKKLGEYRIENRQLKPEWARQEMFLTAPVISTKIMSEAL